MARSIDAETADAHLYELAVATHYVVGTIIVLSVEVNAVAGNLTPPAARFIPVPAGAVMVVIIVGLILRILEIFPALFILFFAALVEIVGAQALGVGVKCPAGVAWLRIFWSRVNS